MKVCFNEKNVRLNVEAHDWKEAIRIGAGLMVDNQIVEPAYVDAIIENVEKYGPYIIIAPGFAMPHARPESGALEMGYSLITLKDPVFFDGDEEPVKIMISFAATDSDKHMDLLKMIVGFVEQNLMKDVAEAKSLKDIQRLLKNAG